MRRNAHKYIFNLDEMLDNIYTCKAIQLPPREELGKILSQEEDVPYEVSYFDVEYILSDEGYWIEQPTGKAYGIPSFYVDKLKKDNRYKSIRHFERWRLFDYVRKHYKAKCLLCENLHDYQVGGGLLIQPILEFFAICKLDHCQMKEKHPQPLCQSCCGELYNWCQRLIRKTKNKYCYSQISDEEFESFIDEYSELHGLDFLSNKLQLLIKEQRKSHLWKT